MVPLIVLLVSLLLFRGLGLLGVDALASWLVAARYALAVMLLLTASAHFTPRKDDLVRMVPDWVPGPRTVVFVTGMLEILGAIGLLLTATRSVAAVALVLLFIAMFPANVRAAAEGIGLGGGAATPLWQRVPMQLLFVGIAPLIALNP